MLWFILGAIVYLAIGTGLLIRDIRNDHSGTWALAIGILWLVILGWPYFLWISRRNH